MCRLLLDLPPFPLRTSPRTRTNDPWSHRSLHTVINTTTDDVRWLPPTLLAL
ncbi:hypothetical protein CGRA01v4_08991 [Colletotrichum graminicola]|nr:hypothetical protein CGRA01v4_08991 [Colletotrichum graminicola]